MSDRAEHTTPETTEKAGGADTESDNAREAIQAMVNEVSREQGGTINAVISGAKGNADKIDLERNEKVHSDPQGFGFELDRDVFGNDHEGDSGEY